MTGIETGPAGRVRVLESVAAPGATLKYIDQVVRYAPEQVEFRYFGWLRALFGRYDVFHVHWPEFLIRSRHPVLATVRAILFRLLLLRLRLTRTPIVRTQHNPRPHAAGDRREERLLDRLDRMTTVRVLLDAATPHAGHGRTVVIPHGDYREQLGGLPVAESVPGRLLTFGRIEPYKAVPQLIDAFEQVAAAGDSLRVVGRPSEAAAADVRTRLAAWRRSDASVTARLEHVDDVDMVTEMTSAEAVVLPYTEMHNSGVLLVALSLGRPVIVPASPTNANIAREVGDGWVIQYEGDFGPTVLRDALARLRSASRTNADLGQRDWTHVAASYADVFRDAASGRRAVDVYVNAGGQRDNIGDSLLRRAYLDALRPIGTLHVYTGPDAEYVAGLGLRDGDVGYASPSRWLVATVLGAARRRSVLAINTGEVVGTAEEHRKGRWQAPVAAGVRVRGGAVVLAGVSVRPGSDPRLTSLGALSRTASVTTWRDQWTRDVFGRGTVQPDWAFVLGSDPVAWAEADGRDVVAVAMRGDRPMPEASWFDGVKAVAERADARIVVVVQVRRDAERAAELAERLGATVLEWAQGAAHDVQERRVRDLYARSAAVISDRIHALIVGYTEGAVPIGCTTDAPEKVARSLAPATAVPVGPTGPGADVQRWLTLLERREDLADDLVTARARIAEVGAQLAALARR